ncbi:MAG: hypothetical protein IKZ83_02680, partial [Prevotella sp.]|nr:hypothetical protein [Prevotella sp.]
AQYSTKDDEPKGRLDGLEYKVEAQVSATDGQTPLWLNANKHGLSSLESVNGYLRGSVERPLRVDSLRRWGIGYGLDVALPYHYTSKMVVQQAYGELRWLHGVLAVGAKEYPMELKNNQLSSGSQTLGINSRPVPQVRLALPDYWILPFGIGWLRMKGHIAYGKTTDDNWQKDFTQMLHPYTEGARYHSKAGYLMIGYPERFFPLSVELGLEMAAQFGGTVHIPDGDGWLVYHGNNGLKGMWRACMPGGDDAPEEGTEYQNAEGNQLGSCLVRVNYETDTWKLGFYAEKYFEDHSSMLQLDYDGYGTGDEWNVAKKRRYFLYDLKDMMLGIEFNKKYGTWLRDVVFEYLYTKYQSGPVYHDHTQAFPDHISGRDNFYNHYLYNGWMHWGQANGNPLYRSPIYNDNGIIRFEDNRFVAFHLGIGGAPTERLSYRLMATYQKGYGTYDNPYTKVRHNFSGVLEATYRLPQGWQVKGAFGMDSGRILGDNYGGQVTVTKKGIFKIK